MRAAVFVVAALGLGWVPGAAAEKASPARGTAAGTPTGTTETHAGLIESRARASATGSRPIVATDGAHATSETTASVEGNADPEGSTTMLHAAYATAKALWCSSGGTRGRPAAKTAPLNIGSGYRMLSELVVNLRGLTPGVQYCVELIATNQFGTSRGGQVRFATPDEVMSSSGTSPAAASRELTVKGVPGG